MQVRNGPKEKEEEEKEEEENEKQSDDGSFDLVLVHLTAEAFSSGAADADADAADAADGIDASQRALSFADSFLKHMRSAPGALDDRGDDALLAAVVFSGGDGGGDEEGAGEFPPALALPPRGGAPLPRLEGSRALCPVPRPAQSFEFAEGSRLEPRSGAAALLVASRCDGVLRADGARRLLECARGGKEKSGKGGESENGCEDDNVGVFPGGNGLGCVLAEHLLDEVAYKIGRALKYGA